MNRIPCRCSDVSNVLDCVKGCTLFVCCGGYITEGHMSDCKKPSTYEIHGIKRIPKYTGEWDDPVVDTSVEYQVTLTLRISSPADRMKIIQAFIEKVKTLNPDPSLQDFYIEQCQV